MCVGVTRGWLCHYGATLSSYIANKISPLENYYIAGSKVVKCNLQRTQLSGTVNPMKSNTMQYKCEI